jgi:hypothetical protein
MSEEIVNKVAQSGIVTISLEDYYPQEEIVVFDLADYLFERMILREKDFRTKLKELDWAQFENKIVAVHCSEDVIIQDWAYMLVASYLNNVSNQVIFGTHSDALLAAWKQNFEQQLPLEELKNNRVVIKGCGNKKLPQGAFLYATLKLQPEVKSLMYGEACSSVPIFKRK